MTKWSSEESTPVTLFIPAPDCRLCLRLGHNAWSVVTPADAVCQVCLSLSIPDTGHWQSPRASPGWGPGTHPGALMALLAKCWVGTHTPPPPPPGVLLQDLEAGTGHQVIPSPWLLSTLLTHHAHLRANVHISVQTCGCASRLLPTAQMVFFTHWHERVLKMPGDLTAQRPQTICSVYWINESFDLSIQIDQIYWKPFVATRIEWTKSRKYVKVKKDKCYWKSNHSASL